MKKILIKRTRLKRKWAYLLGVITTIIILILLQITNNFIKEQMKKCDNIKGYSCTVWESLQPIK